MIKRDYYTVLEVPSNCTCAEIRQSYRRLALIWHPDKCTNKVDSQIRFNEISEAYNVLIDPRRKEIYDKFGHKGIEIDQEGGDYTQRSNIFLQKGFQGTEKSAFDIFRDICTDKDEPAFSQNYEDTKLSEKVKSDVKSFLDANLFSNDDEDDGQDFFKNYKPTFSDPNFMQAPSFSTTEGVTHSTTFFSCFFTNSGENYSSKTSTTMFYESVKTPQEENYQPPNNASKAKEVPVYEQKSSSNLPNAKGRFYDFACLDNLLIIDEEIDGPNFEFYADSGASTGCSLDDLDRDFTNDLNMKCKLSSPSKKIFKLRDTLNLKASKRRPSKKCKY